MSSGDDDDFEQEIMEKRSQKSQPPSHEFNQRATTFSQNYGNTNGNGFQMDFSESYSNRNQNGLGMGGYFANGFDLMNESNRWPNQQTDYYSSQSNRKQQSKINNIDCEELYQTFDEKFQRSKEIQNQQKDENGETEQERLLRITKKQDIPSGQQVTLVDWAIRGSAEIIRLVLELMLIPYKQRKYTYVTKGKWQKEDSVKLKQKYPIVELPYLEDGAKIICGTEAMVVYLLNKYNRLDLLGESLDDKINVATLVCIYQDLYRDYYELSYGQYEEDLDWDDAQDKYINQKFKYHLNKVAGFLKYKTFLGGENCTWVDLAFAEMIDLLNQLELRFKDYLLQLQHYKGRVMNLPPILMYRRSYRFHQRPYNGFGSIFN